MVIVAEIILASEILSAALAFAIAFLMLRTFSVTRRGYLVGFPIGFGFLAMSYLFFGLSYASPSLEERASWIRLFVASYGFAFLAATYVIEEKSEMWIGRISQWLFAFFMIGGVALILKIAVPPFFALPPYRSIDEEFLLFNVLLLGYIILRLHWALRAEQHEVSIAVLAGFIFLAFGQYSLLLRALGEDGFWSFTFAHAFQMAGLVSLFVPLIAGRFHRL